MTEDDALVPTRYHVIRADGTRETKEIMWPREPKLKHFKELLTPLLGDGEPPEHVAVLHEGKRRDMFVSEYGHLEMDARGPLPINAEATRIYRHNWLLYNR